MSKEYTVNIDGLDSRDIRCYGLKDVYKVLDCIKTPHLFEIHVLDEKTKESIASKQLHAPIDKLLLDLLQESWDIEADAQEKTRC